MGNAYKILIGKLEGLQRPMRKGLIILKWTLTEQSVRMWSRFIRARVATSGGSCKHSNKVRVPYRTVFLTSEWLLASQKRICSLELFEVQHRNWVYDARRNICWEKEIKRKKEREKSVEVDPCRVNTDSISEATSVEYGVVIIEDWARGDGGLPACTRAADMSTLITPASLSDLN